MKYNQTKEVARLQTIFEKYSRTNSSILLNYLDYLIDEGIINTLNHDQVMALHTEFLAITNSPKYIFAIAKFEASLTYTTHKHMRHKKITKEHFNSWWRKRKIAYIQLN